MLKIALLTTSQHRSPRVLAETLAPLIEYTGHTAKIYYRLNAVQRLTSLKENGFNSAKRVMMMALFWIGDYLFFRKLKDSNIIIICSCTPFAFYRHTYNINELKRKISDKPVLYYAVQYLANSPTLVEKLTEGGHSLFERYDWHLSVSDITEVRNKQEPPWSHIGLNLKCTGLRPESKKEFLAVLDHTFPGNEAHKDLHKEVLQELRINYIELKGEYTISQIREIYKRASIFFMQSYEAFGMPIAECLACGSYIITPDSAWPMSWRLDENPEIHGKGTLPDCFIVYAGREDLVRRINQLRDNYDLNRTPMEVFNLFYKHYPSLYEGNVNNLRRVLDNIPGKQMKS